MLIIIIRAYPNTNALRTIGNKTFKFIDIFLSYRETEHLFSYLFNYFNVAINYSPIV